METAKQRAENEVEFSRIVAFSDGVFAIAVTLLVLQLGVKPGVTYAISFAVIGRFWLVHHRFFGDVTGFDGRLIVLNLFYLAWIVLIPFSSQILGDHGSAEAAVILYAANLVGVILAGVLLFADARRAGLSRISSEAARSGERSALAIAGIFLLSIVVALFTPELATYCWLALFFVPIAGRALGKAG